jgi:hypothetical protein
MPTVQYACIFEVLISVISRGCILLSIKLCPTGNAIETLE